LLVAGAGLLFEQVTARRVDARPPRGATSSAAEMAEVS
jgi:hypothetical protein